MTPEIGSLYSPCINLPTYIPNDEMLGYAATANNFKAGLMLLDKFAILIKEAISLQALYGLKKEFVLT